MTNIYKNLLIYMSLIDENLSRIFTIGKVRLFKEYVDLIDISNLISRIEKFGPFVDSFIQDFVDKPTEYSEEIIKRLRTEIDWSISQCKSYLKLLEKPKGSIGDAKALTDPKTLASLLLYKGHLEKLRKRLIF